MTSDNCDIIALSKGELLSLDSLEYLAKMNEMFHVLAACDPDITKHGDKFDVPREPTGSERDAAMFQTCFDLKFYNVMCIGWEGDTAYRRGVVMVEKRAFDDPNPKTNTFKLG
ncbi:hypothetical protein CC86DRAFT_407021 [Ophiobolus disseminans]|uniref:Uncharacterized protein n=1 Tax=Ophiobolus disseminans TaxID=1469910 RepID=A0A6A6ZZ01_9PLEO|nr:hypothetical protein CC86DRAFT_407021 [Ophiobolus disseminans]